MTNPTKTIEAVARAIEEALVRKKVERFGGNFSMNPELMDACARAALKALQEPTPEMVEAGRTEFWRHDLDDGSEPMLRSVFRAMLQAAGGEG